MTTSAPIAEPLRRCAALATNDGRGRIAPRPCRFPARAGSDYCGLPAHQRLAHGSHVVGADGGWCVFCGQPGRRYAPADAQRVHVVLCDHHGQSLAKAIRQGR